MIIQLAGNTYDDRLLLAPAASGAVLSLEATGRPRSLQELTFRKART
jgi:hypothetical protein